MSYLAERSVIGALLINSESMNDVYGMLEPDMFTNELLGKIFHEYQRAYDQGYNLTLAMIDQKIKNDIFTSEVIMQEIKSCMSEIFTSANIKQDASVVKNAYKSRRLEFLINSVNATPNNVTEQIGKLLNELDALQNDKQLTSQTLSEITAEHKDKYFKERDIKPVKFGFEKLDALLDLEGGQMVVIGARPSVGKSAFVTQITSYLGKQGKRVGFYNLEMQTQQMYERFIVNESGIGLTRLKKAIRFLGDEQERFDKANETLSKADNIIITSGASKTVAEIRAESKNMDYDVIIIDYLQLLKADKTYRGNRTAEVGEISRSIQSLAMELKIPIIALSQLNRASEGREDKEPNMSELREAGNIEQDASTIILLWNIDENDKTKKGCKIVKNRQGECGKIVMKFNGDTMKFEETDEEVKNAKTWKSSNDNPFD